MFSNFPEQRSSSSVGEPGWVGSSESLMAEGEGWACLFSLRRHRKLGIKHCVILSDTAVHEQEQHTCIQYSHPQRLLRLTYSVHVHPFMDYSIQKLFETVVYNRLTVSGKSSCTCINLHDAS